jgi:hypothetical protein
VVAQGPAKIGTAGTLVEVALARILRGLAEADGAALDYTIAGADVDCKFSHRMDG